MNKRSFIFKHLTILGLLILGFASLIATCGGGGDGITTGNEITDICLEKTAPQLNANVTYKIQTFYQVESDAALHPLPNTKLTYWIYLRDECMSKVVSNIANEVVGYTESDGIFETTIYGVKFDDKGYLLRCSGFSVYDGPSPVDNSVKLWSISDNWVDLVHYDDVKDSNGNLAREIKVVHMLTSCKSTAVTKLTITPTFKVNTYYQVQGENPQALNLSFYMTIFKRPCGKSQINFANKWLEYSEEGTFEYTVNPSQGTFYENSQDVIGIAVEATDIPTGSNLPSGIARLDSSTAEAFISYNEAKNSSSGKITKVVNLILPAYRK